MPLGYLNCLVVCVQAIWDSLATREPIQLKTPVKFTSLHTHAKPITLNACTCRYMHVHVGTCM